MRERYRSGGRDHRCGLQTGEGIGLGYGHENVLKEKLREALRSVLPVIAIVAVLCFTVVPLSADTMLAFLLGALFVIVGITLFTVGSESSLTQIGSRMGSTLTRSRKLPLVIGVAFAVGVFVTVAEPDLRVLAKTVPHIPTGKLVIVVGVGVGLFLALSMLRMVFALPLKYLLFFCYGAVFLLAILAPKDQLTVAFDSGGVTTGPMTVPFILAFGVGISYIRSDARAESDSFGLVALCSVGPILAVLILSFFYPAGDAGPEAVGSAWTDTAAIGFSFVRALPQYLSETALSLLPILIVFLAFQFASFRLHRRSLIRILIGILYTYLGLVLFLTGVNVGFSRLGYVFGSMLAGGRYRYLMIPLSMLLGWFILSAEPAVYTLKTRIEEVSAGAIGAGSVRISLSVAVSLAMGLSMLRVLTGIPVMWFLVPGYAVSLILSFFVPEIYTAIAFDSGGVASGPMTAAFMLQLMIGASSALGGNMLSDAFGVVALVAMMPMISIQILGLAARIRTVNADRAVFENEEIIETLEA